MPRNVEIKEILHEIFRVVRYLLFPATFRVISWKIYYLWDSVLVYHNWPAPLVEAPAGPWDRGGAETSSQTHHQLER